MSRLDRTCLGCLYVLISEIYTLKKDFTMYSLANKLCKVFVLIVWITVRIYQRVLKSGQYLSTFVDINIEISTTEN